MPVSFARTDSRARALILLIVFSLLATLIAGRLAWWHVIQRDRLTAMALEQVARRQEIPAERGEIRDAQGVLLATSVELKSIFATPPSIGDPAGAAALLGPILGEPVDALARRLASDERWVWIKRRVPTEVSDAVRELALPGIGMYAETKRVYPITGVADGTTMAAHALGYVNVDGIGQYGIEEARNDLLAGQPGWVAAEEDVVGRQIADSAYELRQPVDGTDIQLTLDAGLKHLLETEILRTFGANRAKGATGLVMDVETGAILGMASFPSFDANAYSTTDPARFVNPAVSRQYEPGSVIKPFTVAAALEAGAITTADTFVDDNNLQLANVRIQNADRWDHPWGHGAITAGEVLRLSNNVGAAKIGLDLGPQRLYQAFRQFGFGSPTGIELAGEASGVVWDPDGERGSGQLTAAQNSFGQGLSVTAVQLATGYAALANGGRLMRPYVLASWTDAEGTVHETQPTEVRRIVSEETSATMRRLLTDAIDEGIAEGASIPGYSVAGKTGTAQIAGPVTVPVAATANANGKQKVRTTTVYRYINGWIDSSFIGFVPAQSPRVVMLVLIHRPAVWGLYRMQERPEDVFHKLAPRILDYLAIPPDRPGEEVAAP